MLSNNYFLQADLELKLVEFEGEKHSWLRKEVFFSLKLSLCYATM